MRRLKAEFVRFEERVDALVAAELERLGPDATADDASLQGPGSTWTYIVDDNPFRYAFGLGLVAMRGVGGLAALAAGPFLGTRAVAQWLERRLARPHPEG